MGPTVCGRIPTFRGASVNLPPWQGQNCNSIKQKFQFITDSSAGQVRKINKRPKQTEKKLFFGLRNFKLIKGLIFFRDYGRRRGKFRRPFGEFRPPSAAEPLFNSWSSTTTNYLTDSLFFLFLFLFHSCCIHSLWVLIRSCFDGFFLFLLAFFFWFWEFVWVSVFLKTSTTPFLLLANGGVSR